MILEARQSRFLPIAGIAATSTFALFYMMQGLVASDIMDFTEPKKIRPLQITIEDIKTLPVRDIDRVPPPPPVEPEPTIEIEQPPKGGGVDLQIGAAPTPNFRALDDGLANLGFSDGERLPLVRVTPVYPRRALERGVEGWVILEFTVSTQGTVENPVVIESDPAGYFDRAALNAIKKFKYKPTVIDGQPKASHGVRFRMSFHLNDTE